MSSTTFMNFTKDEMISFLTGHGVSVTAKAMKHVVEQFKRLLEHTTNINDIRYVLMKNNIKISNDKKDMTMKLHELLHATMGGAIKNVFIKMALKDKPDSKSNVSFINLNEKEMRQLLEKHNITVSGNTPVKLLTTFKKFLKTLDDENDIKMLLVRNSIAYNHGKGLKELRNNLEAVVAFANDHKK